MGLGEHKEQTPRDWFIRQTRFHRSALILTLAVCVVILGFRGFALLSRPANLERIATEVGSVAEFWGEPVPNRDGTRIAFLQSTEQGVALFLCAMPNGDRVPLWEQPERGFAWKEFKPWGWSPDSRWFAYSRRPDKESKRELVICDGESGGEVSVVPVERTVVEFAWMSPVSFAILTDQKELLKSDQLSEKKWMNPRTFRRSAEKKAKRTKEEIAATPPISALAALSPETVLYQQDNAVWQWTFGAEEPLRIWESTNGALVDFSYDAKGRQLLLHCKNDSHESLVSYYLPTKWISAVGSIEAPSFFTYRVATFAGAGYAFVRRGIGNHILHVVSEPGRDPVPVSFDGGINSYAGGGGGLYVFGSRSGEPVGIWRFDPSTSIVSCVVSNSRPFFEYARPVAPARHTVTNSEGQVLSFRLWAPPRVSPGRKYPLIIGKASTRWIGYPGGIANAGAYVVSVEQDEDHSDWTDEAVPIYEHLRTRLGIDRENLFLYAASGHVPRVSALLKSHPDLWKGAILFSPGSFPDLSQLGISKLLIDCGGQDFRAEAVSKFQDEAARLGVVVTVAVHEDAGHVYTSVASLRGRDQAVLRFLFGH